MHVELRYSRTEAYSLRWEQAHQLGLAHDCLEFDRFRQQVNYHLTQCAILHAQIVCSVTEYLENIQTAYVCPPNYCNPGIPPFGDLPHPQSQQQPQYPHAENAQQAERAQRAQRTEDDREPTGRRERPTTRS
jgi:hypothetical protein